jgi:hypothetical protein
MIMLNIPSIHLTPQQLNAQCPVKIDEWIDVYSQRAREIDDMYDITIKWLKIAVESNMIFIDSLGRLWAQIDQVGIYAPYHIEYGHKLVGYRVSARAAN